MKRQFKYIKLRQGSKEWEEFRNSTGFGGSDIGSVLATESQDLAELTYTPPLKLFLDRLGEPIQHFTGNVASEAGKFFEPIILNYYKHYDFDLGDQMAMFKNIRDNRPVNGLWCPNGVIQNPKWPWLYYSPDGLGTVSVGSKVADKILEAKMTTSYETQRYSNKVNPSFYLQCMLGLMLTGFEVGYVLLLVDGRWFEPIKIYPDQQVFDTIVDVSYKFWRSILQARKIKLEYGLNVYFNVNPDSLTEKQKEGVQMLSELEPSLIGSDNELTFIREMIIPPIEKVEREGSEEERIFCQQYLQANEALKNIGEQKNAAASKLLLSLKGCNYVKFDDGKSGYFSYLSDKNGKKNIRVSIK